MPGLFSFVAILFCFLQCSACAADFSPVAVVADPQGKQLYIADATANRVVIFDVVGGKVTGSINLSQPAAGLALSPDGRTLYVAGAAPEGQIHVMDTASRKWRKPLPAGHTPSAVAVTPDGAKLYVANRFNNNIGMYDLVAGKELSRIPVCREPVAVAVSPDGQSVCVANLMPTGPATSNYVAAAVTLIDAKSDTVAANLPLPDGSVSLRGVCYSPDGRYVYVTHILAHYQLPTTQLERGWMCTAALTVVDAPARRILNTVLLDEIELGAANPWGVACTADGKQLCVTHAGSHELSVIDRAALHERLDKAGSGQRVTEVTGNYKDVPSDLMFLVGIRRRIKLSGLGSRGLALVGGKAYVAEYFSNALAVVDIAPSTAAPVREIPLGPKSSVSIVRRGELIFHNADHCFQKWQSCSSCHPDVRTDGLNWDLLNDGIGNPKNTRNMLYAHRTPPAMSLSVREGAEHAVRAGFKFIQFSLPPEEDCKAVDEFLKSLRPVPSPHLVSGRLSPSARRGQYVFKKAGCADCHSGPFYTNKQEYDVGTGVGPDKGRPFDTPALNECWRTAPYMHDGRAATMMEVLTTSDRHGKT